MRLAWGISTVELLGLEALLDVADALRGKQRPAGEVQGGSIMEEGRRGLEAGLRQLGVVQQVRGRPAPAAGHWFPSIARRTEAHGASMVFK